MKTLKEAIFEDASRRYFTYKAPAPADDPPEGTKMTREEWQQLSPGYRREITRQFNK